jgi:phage/plasmid-associated DNA primase
MRHVITKIEGMSFEIREQLIGEGRIAQKAMPSSVASVINWAANECGTPIMIIGQVVHTWCGTHYESTRMYDVMEATLRFLECPISLAVDPDFVRSVEKSLSACVDRYGSAMNENPRGLNFKDGRLMISRDNIEFLEGHDPMMVFTYCLPFNYIGERQESKVWSKFIQQIIPDEQMRRYTLTSFINAIAGDPMNAQRMLLLMGVGASGKSTLIDALVNVIGKKNACRVDDLRNLTKDESRYRIDLANHILCICGDASGNLGNKDVLKQIVSKEEISGRRLYKEVEYFVPRASLLVASNEIGFTHALGDSGISRRIDIIQFKHPVEEKDRDPFIGEKLANPIEQREMVMDMIDCLIEMQKTHGRMVRPESLSSALDDMRFDGDAFLSFIAASGMSIAADEEASPSKQWIHQTELFGAFNRYCLANGNATGSMRLLKGKCESHGVIREAAGKRQHKFLFDIVDKPAYRVMFYFNHPNE